MDEPFIILEDSVLNHLPVIKSQGLTIYTVIKRHLNHETKKAFPSIERIAAMCCLTQKTVIKYLRILEAAGLLIVSKRWINKNRCFHEYYFPRPPIAFPWEKTKSKNEERNTPQPDPNPIKKKEKQNAKTVPIIEEPIKSTSEEIVEDTCTCEDVVVFPDGRIVCKKCLRTGVIDAMTPDTPTRQPNTPYSAYSDSICPVRAPALNPQSTQGTRDARRMSMRIGLAGQIRQGLRRVRFDFRWRNGKRRA